MAVDDVDINRLRRHRVLAAARASFVAIVSAAGCRQDMHDAPRYDPLESEPGVAEGQPRRSRSWPGTVPRGGCDDDELLDDRQGRRRSAATVFPFAITRADLDRGQERFNIYCAPCHGKTGDGNGMVVQRGYRQRGVVPHRAAAAGARRATSSTSSPTASARCRTTARRSRSTTAGASSPTSARCS